MKKIQKNLVLPALVVVSLCLLSTQASAWWGCCGPYWGGSVWGPAWFGPTYSVAYDPCCAPVCCDPCVTCGPVCDTGYALGWRPGPIRRLLFGRYRWYPTGYWGGYAYSYGDACCGDVAYSGEIYDGSDIPLTPAPAAPTKKSSVVEPSPNDDLLKSTEASRPIYHRASYASAETKETPVPANSGLLKIYVPIDAKVFVNDHETTTDGSVRSFISYGLSQGNEYDYVVRAEVIRNGQKYVETKLVTLQAGQNQAVAFGFEPLNPGPSDTYVEF